MLERRKRVSKGWFDTEEVPALRLEACDVPPGAQATIRGAVNAVFRGLELEVDAGKNEFDIHSMTVDGEPQLLVDEPISAAAIDGDSLQFPYTEEDGEMVLVVRNIGAEPRTFRAFVLGRLREPWEKIAS